MADDFDYEDDDVIDTQVSLIYTYSVVSSISTDQCIPVELILKYSHMNILTSDERYSMWFWFKQSVLNLQAAQRKRLFSKELCAMMYGFGDDRQPFMETVDLLEELVIEFITDLCHRAMEIGMFILSVHRYNIQFIGWYSRYDSLLYMFANFH